MKKLQLLPLLAGVLGLLGIVVCGAAIAGVWLAGSRLIETNEIAFDRIDKALAAVGVRIGDAQTRVEESKITTEDVRQSVRSWTGKEASERIGSRLDVEEKAERLVTGLQQAEVWLETSGASMQRVQQALVMGSSLGVPVDAELVDPLLEQLGEIRGRLQQATETVDGIRERVTKTTEDEGLEERMDELAQLAVRVVATLSEVDSRLGKSAENVADVQTNAQQLGSKTHSYIVTMGICAVLLIAWMMAGQVSLCRHGWRRYRDWRTAA